MNDYQKRIDELFKKIPKNIVDPSIPKKKTSPPTQAFSDFLTHREQGDWAETAVQEIINKSVEGLKAVKYGKSDDIIAGDEGFSDFYKKYQEELETIGKRPDLLLFTDNQYKDEWPQSLSKIPAEEVKDIVSLARAGLEIRSSAFLVNQYQDYISKNDKKRARAFLSFTPKAEDLIVIHRWVMNYGVKHFYVQVFFDKVYAISFEKILEIITNPEAHKVSFTLEKNAKSQFKSTLHIDVGQGIVLIDKLKLPEHSSAVKELGRGRLLYYVKFKGGEGEINLDQLLSEIEG